MEPLSQRPGSLAAALLLLALSLPARAAADGQQCSDWGDDSETKLRTIFVVVLEAAKNSIGYHESTDLVLSEEYMLQGNTPAFARAAYCTPYDGCFNATVTVGRVFFDWMNDSGGHSKEDKAAYVLAHELSHLKLGHAATLSYEHGKSYAICSRERTDRSFRDCSELQEARVDALQSIFEDEAEQGAVAVLQNTCFDPAAGAAAMKNASDLYRALGFAINEDSHGTLENRAERIRKIGETLRPRFE